MAPSLQSTPCLIAAQTKPIAEDVDELKELKSNGRWAAAIIFVSVVYGECTVATQLTRDPRQNSWWLMISPIPTVLLSFAYIYAVTYLGPNFMKNKKSASGLRTLMMVYNAFQVGFSAWLFYEAGMGGWFGSYSFICQTCDFSNHPQAIRMMHCGYWYYFSKFVDFIDTIFFVLHKKYEHISLLHVCHHAIMPINMWYGVRYQPGGHATLMGFLNTFVHTVMYAYYLLAAMGPRVRPFLWWKKYLTSLQLIQFIIVFFHSIIPVFVDCAVPRTLATWVGSVAVMFFVLFMDFYIKAYRKRGINQVSNKTKVLDNGFSNGVANGVGAKLPNGIANGIAAPVYSITNGVGSKLPNGVANGIAAPNNSIANGVGSKLSNGVANGIATPIQGIANGVGSKLPNGIANGTAAPVSPIVVEDMILRCRSDK